ncbi:nitrate reductase cytochrome c-type subunit [Paracoccus sp. S1E-3]|uniref:nitrate reductase cytochrome c-type subunit n=1 Tax=Paracoccus sp. S1E-3 TaxID=2756130 RepID=UPI001C692BCC|nr:nitrate reductase cytochrome c-type subunit [Paracoccus sp. S1E-3]
MNPLRLIAALLTALLFAGAAPAQDLGAEAGLRSAPEINGPQPPMENADAAPIPRWITDDVRLMRQYPEQPPIIPHSIEGYQLSVNANRCMSCHRREATEGSGAPMISVTHYMTREGQMLADVSPRRYFCTACHVPQADAKPLVDNTFTDMADMGVKQQGEE